jgi:hypothetical protein
MNLTKTPKPKGGPAVRQVRGPGMNKGLKKPRYGKFAKPDAEKSQSSSSKPLTPTEKPSYLSKTLVPTGGSLTPKKR